MDQEETLRQLVKDLCDKFEMSMRSTSEIEEHTPPMVVESDKLLLQAADPSATSSVVTRSGVQDGLDHETGESSATPLVAKKTAEEEMASEAKDFDRYRRDWEAFWGPTAVLSSMQFTNYTPGRLTHHSVASTPATLQIFSIKLVQVAGGLRWPLSVYGVVAVRDEVDHNRNFLFSCDRNYSQELTQNDPFLRLIGPSRAVVFTDEVNLEVELKVKGTTAYQDKALITKGCEYRAFGNGVSTVCFKNCFCTVELCVQTVRKTVQATILGVQVASGEPFPFEHGARVTCSPLQGEWDYTDNRITIVTYPTHGEIVMVDSKDEKMLKGSDGYLHLPRNVISVGFKGMLDVDIQAYSKSGDVAAKERVSLQPRCSKISQKTCCIRGVTVAVTIAWSLVATDKFDVMSLGSLV
ncbi:unnamed protein product [Alopecurus aequalis]